MARGDKREPHERRASATVPPHTIKTSEGKNFRGLRTEAKTREGRLAKLSESVPGKNWRQNGRGYGRYRKGSFHAGGWTPS